jgi:hypothetical protein
MGLMIGAKYVQLTENLLLETETKRLEILGRAWDILEKQGKESVTYLHNGIRQLQARLQVWANKQANNELEANETFVSYLGDVTTFKIYAVRNAIEYVVNCNDNTPPYIKDSINEYRNRFRKD